MNMTWILLMLVFGVTVCGKEVPEHAHKHDFHDHMKQHDEHYDHAAILGDREEEKEFDQLPPEEAKKRLQVIVKKMDENGDGFVSKDELFKWILASLQKLDEADALEILKEHDTDKDGKVTWNEYIFQQFGYNETDLKDFKARDDEDLEEFKRVNKLIVEDELKFKAADENKDGALDLKEYVAFEFPADYIRMHEIEIDRSFAERDKNKDGTISVSEFLEEEGADTDDQKKEEEERFKEFDKDNDGSLTRAEIKPWVIPDNSENARDEMTHLFDVADDNKDDKLSEEEILEHHEDFVGSQATDYGNSLKDEL